MAVNLTNAVSAYANAGRVAAQAGPTQGGGSFADMLKGATENVLDTVSKGEQASLNVATGKADLTTVTEAVNNAEVAVQTVVAIRDRVVAAYQDIMRMPI